MLLNLTLVWHSMSHKKTVDSDVDNADNDQRQYELKHPREDGVPK